jgi:Fis family transcriptional regulator
MEPQTQLINGQALPLSEHVSRCLTHYFATLKDHEAAGLYDMVMTEVEKPLLAATLAHADCNQSKAAKMLGISRSTLRKKLEHYGLS